MSNLDSETLTDLFGIPADQWQRLSSKIKLFLVLEETAGRAMKRVIDSEQDFGEKQLFVISYIFGLQMGKMQGMTMSKSDSLLDHLGFAAEIHLAAERFGCMEELERVAKNGRAKNHLHAELFVKLKKMIYQL
jgi:hypothetical protein